MNLRPLLALLALGGVFSTALATPVSPASQLFERGVSLVDRYYDGNYAANRTVHLLQYERKSLRQRCELTPSTCKASIGREVLADYLELIEDGHLYVLAPDDYAALKARLTQQVPTKLTYGLVLDGLVDGQAVVTDVASGSPAEQAGLQPGDRILNVNGAAAPDGSGLDDIPQLRLSVARGPVKAEVRREVTLTRTNRAPLLLPTLYAPAGAPKGVLVLRIPSFQYAGQVGPRVHDLVRQAQARGAQALIVDMRGGNGGSVFETEMATGAFTGPFRFLQDTKLGTFVMGWLGTRSLDTSERAFSGIAGIQGQLFQAYDVPNPARWTGKVVVLVDHKTGSGSEYMAYYLQRFLHAKVIGSTTRGLLNSSDAVFDLPGGVGLLVPVARPLNTDGSPFPGWVTPDAAASADIQRFTETGVDPFLEVAYKTLGVATED